MANLYEDFVGHFSDYSRYATAYNSAGEGRLSLNLKELAASLVNDDFTKNYFLNVTKDPNEFRKAFGKAIENRKGKIDAVTGNLEDLLNDAPEKDVSIGVQMVEPKDSYSGTKAGLYDDIAKLHKKIKSMAGVAQSGDYGQMKTDVNEHFSTVYDTSKEKDKESLEIINILLEGGEFGQYMYEILASKKQEEFSEKLQGNEVGYLAANLEGKDFIEFYAGLSQMKEELARQSQGQGGRPSQRQRRSR